jgi:hypothetical protein
MNVVKHVSYFEVSKRKGREEEVSGKKGKSRTNLKAYSP